MPGTRTAPAVAGTPSRTVVSMSFFDQDDGQTTVSFPIDPASSDAEIEAVAGFVQAISNASLYEVSITETYLGVGIASNALADDYVSVKDAIRLSSRSGDGNAYIRAYAPAPLGTLVGAGGSIVVTNAAYISWRDAFQALLPAGYALINTGFIQNVARNKGQSPVA